MQQFYFSKCKECSLIAQTLRETQNVRTAFRDNGPQATALGLQRETAVFSRGRRADSQHLQNLTEVNGAFRAYHRSLRTVYKMTMEHLRKQRYRGWSLNHIRRASKLSRFLLLCFHFCCFYYLEFPSPSSPG